jgi:hypothetical protein
VGGPDLLKNLGAKIFEKRQRMKLDELLAEEEGVGGRGKGQKMKMDANVNAIASIYLAERSAHFVDVSRVRPETIVHACGKHAWAPRTRMERARGQQRARNLQTSILLPRSRWLS